MEPDDNERHIFRQKAQFQARMRRFEKYSQFTKLNAQELSWPLIKGHQMREYRLVGSSFPDEPLEVDPQMFESTSFLETTAEMLYSAGAGPQIPQEICEFVFSIVMKTLATYCNYLYENAEVAQKTKISTDEVLELLKRNEFRFWIFFRHFYPYPNQTANDFHNYFSSKLHELFWWTDGYSQFYLNTEFPILARERTAPIVQNQCKFYPIDANFMHKVNIRFCSPDGLRLSKFHALRFHEALGLPPLEIEMILVMDWFARMIVTEIVLTATVWCHDRQFDRLPTLEDYKEAMKDIGDFFFDLPMDFFPVERPLHLENSPKFTRRKFKNPNCLFFYERINASEEYRKNWLNRHFREGNDRLFTLKDSADGVRCSRRR